VKSSASPSFSNSWLLSHVRLPRENEAICIDDLSLFVASGTIQDNFYSSSICWRYSSRRSLINVRIKPLPFVGVANDLDGSVQTMKTISENSDELGSPVTNNPATHKSSKSLAQNSLKCFLEYLNECTRQFVLVKEFFIQDGQYTNVIEDLHLNNANRCADYKGFVSFFKLIS
jgi:hypothetical protein